MYPMIKSKGVRERLRLSSLENVFQQTKEGFFIPYIDDTYYLSKSQNSLFSTICFKDGKIDHIGQMSCHENLREYTDHFLKRLPNFSIQTGDFTLVLGVKRSLAGIWVELYDIKDIFGSIPERNLILKYCQENNIYTSRIRLFNNLDDLKFCLLSGDKLLHPFKLVLQTGQYNMPGIGIQEKGQYVHYDGNNVFVKNITLSKETDTNHVFNDNMINDVWLWASYCNELECVDVQVNPNKNKMTLTALYKGDNITCTLAPKDYLKWKNDRMGYFKEHMRYGDPIRGIVNKILDFSNRFLYR